MAELAETPTVAAALIPVKDEITTLTEYFGKNNIKVEAGIFGHMCDLCSGFDGGFFLFYGLDNGGFYMAPDVEGLLHITRSSKGFEADVSADAAGIVACLLAYSGLCSLTPDGLLTDRYYQLHKFALHHPEADLILKAIA